MSRRVKLDTPQKKWLWNVIKRMGGVKVVAKGMFVGTWSIYSWVQKERVPEGQVEPFVLLAKRKQVDITERQVIDFSLGLLAIKEDEL